MRKPDTILFLVHFLPFRPDPAIVGCALIGWTKPNVLRTSVVDVVVEIGDCSKSCRP